jgi:MotA/TolQ/ExbB proton channel family
MDKKAKAFDRFSWPHWQFAVFLAGHEGATNVWRRLSRLSVLLVTGWIVATAGLWALNRGLFGVSNIGSLSSPQWDFSVAYLVPSTNSSVKPESIDAPAALNTLLAAHLNSQPSNAVRSLPQLHVEKRVFGATNANAATTFVIEATISFATNKSAPPAAAGTRTAVAKTRVEPRPVLLLSVTPEIAQLLTWPTFVVATGVSAQSLAKSLTTIAERGPFGDKSGAASEEAIRNYVAGVERIFRELDVTTHPKVVWLRRLNGLIQFWTFWIFGSLLVALGARYACLVRAEGIVSRNFQLTQFRDEPEDELIAGYETAQVSLRQSSECLGSWLQSPVLEICKQAILGYRVGGHNISQVHGFIRAAEEGFIERNNSSGAYIRYLLWAIPTVGFIGTVVGIGNSLMITNELQSVDEILKELGRSRVNTNIAVAFDTTFVGLVLSLIGMYLHSAVGDEEEATVQRTAHETKETLSTLQNADPAVTVINMREPTEIILTKEPNILVHYISIFVFLLFCGLILWWFATGQPIFDLFDRYFRF